MVQTLTDEEWEQLTPGKKKGSQGQWDEYIDALQEGKSVRVDVDNDKDRGNKKRALGRAAAARGIKLEFREGDSFFGARKEGDREPSHPGRKKGSTAKEKAGS